jgi:RNA recognition motif-containing protein
MTEPTADPIVAMEKSATDGLPKVFVGNLDYAVTEEELLEEFSKIGLVYVFDKIWEKREPLFGKLFFWEHHCLENRLDNS